jgi:RNA polymerase sigma factor (sigma-70 family)
VEPTTDHDLLAQYRRGSEDAFAQLVRRHIAWVHSIARRRVRDVHLADDVTQATFIVLARKAAALRPNTVLPAWLFRVTTYAAVKATRSESRRSVHEMEAAMRRARVDQPDETLTELAPLLDDFVGRLRQKDREAILLRFYQRLSFTEVAAALRTTEEASRTRVVRAL